MKLDIDCLKNLHSGQLQQLRGFIESLGYRKAAERASEEFNQQIHKTALQRFMRRAAPAEFLDDEPETQEASRQILKFAADGQPDFTASTVSALEKLAFQLTLTCTSMDEDMHALTKISTMLCRFRNVATRERMAAVQEGKLKLRQQQLEKAANQDTDAQIQELNEKIAIAFRRHPVLTAIRNAQAAQSSAYESLSETDELQEAHGSNLDPDPNLSPNPETPEDRDSQST